MTELKRPCVLQLRHNNSEGFVYAYEVGEMNKYLSEVDKVIADKDAKILALDAEVFKQKHHAELFFDERNNAEAQLRHQKHKRCLNKADFCLLETAIFLNNEERKNFYYRWHKRWLKIADKFKEAR